MSAAIINVDTSLTNIPTINIGKQGENKATQVVFDVSEMIDTYGSGTAVVVVQRRGDLHPYELDNTSQSGDKVTWTVSNTDTAVYGTGRVQLFWTINDEIAKTVTYAFFVEEALSDPTDAPYVPDGGWISEKIGDLDSLTTTDKDNLVEAINEVDGNTDTNTTAIGTLDNLTTTEKSNLVGAINEVDADVSDVKEDLSESKSGKMFINGSFTYGIFDSSNMPESDPRKFNAVMMTAEKYSRDITIIAKSGYNFLAYWYNDSDVYVGKSSAWETSRTIPKNTNFRLWVRPNPLDTSVILDLDTVKKSIIFNTVLKDEVDKNTQDINSCFNDIKLNAKGFESIETDFVWGSMNTSTGAVNIDQAYKYQVVMPNFVTYDRDVTIKCNSGYRFQVWWYQNDGTYISRTGSFKTSSDEYKVTAGTNFRLFVTLDPPDNSARIDPSVFASNVFIITELTERVKAIEEKPLSTLPEYILNTMSYKPIGQLSKGYILMTCDDGTEGLATYTIPMLIDKGVPATFGLLSTSAVITNEQYLATLLDALENHGCCVAMHGSAQWTTLSEFELNKYFVETENMFANVGVTDVQGAICPGGANADTSTLVQAVAGGRFGSVFSGNRSDKIKYGNYKANGCRTNMYDLDRYSAIGFTSATYQQAIDDAYDNHYILCPFWHDYSVVNDTAKQAVIEGMIDYAKTKGLTFITMADLPYIT